MADRPDPAAACRRCGHRRDEHMPYQHAAACEVGWCTCHSYRRRWRPCN